VPRQAGSRLACQALGVVMEEGFAERFAKEWIAAWNSHDLDRILGHYEDDFEMSSPVIPALVGEPSDHPLYADQFAPSMMLRA
jgi:ketosteroid isomerase-like protein